MSDVEPPLGTLRLGNPDEFIAGGLRTNPNAWKLILRHHPLAQEILGWISHRVDILHFSQPFSGSYKGVHYRSDRPLAGRFVNHASCKRFSQFVSLEPRRLAACTQAVITPRSTSYITVELKCSAFEVVRNSIESMCLSYSAFDWISWNRLIAYYSFTDLKHVEGVKIVISA